jgi:DNA-binding NtrC family response regulator
MAQAHHPNLALVVEDDSHLRSLAVALLSETDLTVVEAESAEAALSFMQHRGGEVALVFADVRLAGLMDGVDLARVVAKLWPCTRVVVTSGYGGDRLKRLPPTATYMPKPWRGLDVLMQADRATLDPAQAVP